VCIRLPALSAAILSAPVLLAAVLSVAFLAAEIVIFILLVIDSR
jgi:hypothetical protein